MFDHRDQEIQRFRVTPEGQEALDCTLRCSDSGEPERDSVSFTLMNLSSIGVQLVGTSGLPVGSDHVMRLRHADQQSEVALRIRWAMPQTDELWLHGCQFTEEIPHDVIDQLGGAGWLQRRAEQRQSSDLECRLRGESHTGAVQATLMDYAPGGVGLFTSVEPPSASKLMLQILQPNAAPLSVILRSRWTLEVPSGWMAGCQFVALNDYHEVRDAAALAPDLGASDGELMTADRQRKRRWF